MANRFFPNAGHFYSTHNMPVQLDCNFVVDSSNGNGLGIRSLKGPGVVNVFMHTSSSPGIGNNNITNPNPASGTILVQLADNYNRLITGSSAIVSPVGSNLKVDLADAALTPGVAYVITIVGDATQADWVALGLPPGLAAAPAVGMPFIALVSGHGTASVTRVAPSAAAGSGIFMIETVGDSNTAIAPNPSANQGYGAQIILQCRNDSSSDASQLAAPADNSVISLSFILSNSSVLVAGE